MLGTAEHAGIIPRTVQYLFELADHNTTLSYSYMQIYQEKVILLSSQIGIFK